MVYFKRANIWSIFIIQFRYNAHTDWLKKHGLFQKGEHLIYFYNTVRKQRALCLDEKPWFIPKRPTFSFLSIFIIQFRCNVHSDWLKNHGLFQKGKHLIFPIIQFRYNAHSGWTKNHGLFQKGEHFAYFYITVQIKRAFWLVEKAFFWFIIEMQTFDLFL